MSTREGLPEGWVEKTIGDLVHQKVPQDGPENDSSFVYVDISSVNNEAKRIDDPRTLTSAEAPSRARQRLEHGDVLVSMTRPNLNAVAIVPESLHGAIGSTGFDVLRPKEVIPGWLFYAVQSNAFIRAMCELVQGALYPAVRPRDIRAYRLTVPSLSEQRHIAEKIEELFSDLDAGIASLTRAKANLKRYRASILKAAVEGRLTEEWRKKNPQAEDGQMLLDRISRERREKWEQDQLAGFAAKGKEPPKNWQSKYGVPELIDTSELLDLPEGWTWATVKQLASDVTVGHVGPMKDRYTAKGIPFLRSQNVRPLRFESSGLQHIPQDFHEALAKSCLKGGELLVVRSGVNVGDSCIYPLVADEANCSDVVITRLCGSVCGAFACLFIASPTGQKAIGLRRTGSAMPHFNVGAMASSPFPLPPLAEQVRIVAFAEERLSQIEAAEKTIDAELIRSKKLRDGILKQAFEGKLFD